jgi:hypothetical protein
MKKNLCQREELGQRHPVKHCPSQPDFVRVGVSGKFVKKNYLRLKPDFADMI